MPPVPDSEYYARARPVLGGWTLAVFRHGEDDPAEVLIADGDGLPQDTETVFPRRKHLYQEMNRLIEVDLERREHEAAGIERISPSR